MMLVASNRRIKKVIPRSNLKKHQQHGVNWVSNMLMVSNLMRTFSLPPTPPGAWHKVSI